MRIYQKSGFLLLLLLGSMSCKKTNNSQVPNTLVDITIYTTDPQFFKLNAIGGWVYITGGVRGIIVYHQSPDQYMAYDRNCTFNPSASNAFVSVDSTNVSAVDTSCGSKFLLYDGSVTKGPATFGLKQYNTLLSGSALRIYSQ